MSFHVVEALIQSPQHIREVLPANSISSTRGIESPGSRVQKVVILKIILYIDRKLRVTFLRR